MPAKSSADDQVYGYHYEKYHVESGEVISDGFSRVDVTGMKAKVAGFAFRVTPVVKHEPGAVSKAEAAAKARTAELEDVLQAVAQQFRRYGNNFPDGFDGRVFRWVDDALAAKPLPRARTLKSPTPRTAAKRHGAKAG